MANGRGLLGKIAPIRGFPLERGPLWDLASTWHGSTDGCRRDQLFGQSIKENLALFDFLELIDAIIELVKTPFSKDGRRELLSCFLVMIIAAIFFGGIGYWIYTTGIAPAD